MPSDASVGTILQLLQNDPHQWSMRPCATCQAMTSIVGKDFGCVLYAKRKVTKTFTGDEVVEILRQAIDDQLRVPESNRYSVVNGVLEACGITHKRFDRIFDVLEAK